MLLEKNLGALWGAFAVLGAGVFLLMKSSRGFVSEPQIYFGYTWLALFYLCFILLALLSPNQYFKSFLKNPLLRQFGMIAYGMYLFHQGVLGLVHGVFFNQEPRIATLPDWIATCIAFLLTAGLAKVSWFFFERPIIEWGHRMKYVSAAPPLQGSRPLP